MNKKRMVALLATPLLAVTMLGSAFVGNVYGGGFYGGYPYGGYNRSVIIRQPVVSPYFNHCGYGLNRGVVNTGIIHSGWGW